MGERAIVYDFLHYRQQKRYRYLSKLDYLALFVSIFFVYFLVGCFVWLFFNAPEMKTFARILAIIMVLVSLFHIWKTYDYVRFLYSEPNNLEIFLGYLSRYFNIAGGISGIFGLFMIGAIGISLIVKVAWIIILFVFCGINIYMSVRFEKKRPPRKLVKKIID